jgi:hypothetical protein
MNKESKETFSGKLKDQTFEVFDEKVLTVQEAIRQFLCQVSMAQ